MYNILKFDYVHEDIQTLIILEIALILGDLFYIFTEAGDKVNFLLLRLFFLGCSLFNFGSAIYITVKYELWHLTYQGVREEAIRRMSSLIKMKNLEIKNQSMQVSKTNTKSKLKVGSLVSSDDTTNTNSISKTKSKTKSKQEGELQIEMIDQGVQ